ncbi:phosphoglycerate kinase [Prosthecomicrobium hirschii]|uniref:Phosphoglycerate kinase n=1 Tax=Prosthecodimorpha hirschii TaxID=665126 RepID=A0A0P6VIY9_9HYPH|nr:phosphoglycerate kinase [Prosthecomicrobium hirschii]KPL52181.1 phosphoglycerate kinase [Prosthecomicrobium hirschii]
MNAFKTLDDASLSARCVLVRVDLNVPMEGGAVSDDTRIRAVVPTIREIADKGGRVVLLAHFGRPKDGPEAKFSLAQIVAPLAERVGRPVAFAADCIGPVAADAVAALKDGDILLLENTRFHKGEEKNDPAFVEALAALGDVYVNDAFATAHRAHASTEGLAHRLPAYAGRCMQGEIEALEKALGSPERPVLAVVGGAKVSSKIDLLENLVGKVDILVIGGGMANTFLAAQGIAVGKSLCEHDLAETARRILDKAKAARCDIVLPVDAVVAREFKAGADNEVVPVGAVPADAMILDVGPKSVAAIAARIDGARTLVWNGPLGAFEIEPFDRATVAAARHAAERTRSAGLLTVAGGGDTAAALNHAGVAEAFSYVSTAGGAFLEWLEGKPLPGVEILRK